MSTPSAAATRRRPATSGTTRLPLVVYVLAAGTFLMGTSEFIVAGLLAEMARAFDVDVARAGLAVTTFAVGMILGAPTMALLTLRVPRRRTLILALATFAAGHLVVALSSSFPLMLGARFVTALATGAFWSVASVLAARSVGPAASSRALGVVLSGGMLANVLGVPAGSFAGHVAGWRAPFATLAVLALLAATVIARTVPHDHREHGAPSVRAEFVALRSRRLWLVLATCALVTGGVLSVYTLIAPLLTERAGLSGRTVPLALVIFGVGALLGSLLGGRAGDAHPYATGLAAAAVTFLASGGLVLFSDLPVLALLLFALLGLTGLSANPMYVALAVRFGGHAPTLATAMATSLFNLGTAIGTAISAATLNTSLGATGPALVGAVCAALIVVPLGALTLSARNHPQRS